MDTSLLEAFVHVTENSSFSLAADQLHLTQSAVSKRIALLEEQLDRKLFDRIARTVSLTEAGSALLPRARAILAELALTRQVIADLNGSVSGRLRLAISHHIGLRRLPPVLKRYAALHPQVSIDVAFMDSEQAYQSVLQGGHELAVITLAPTTNTKIVAGTIWSDPMAFVAAPDHSLGAPGKIQLADLQHYPAILPGLNTYTGHIVDKLFRSRSLTLNISMTTNYLETIKAMVAIGLGWSLLPRTMIDDELGVINLPNIQLTRKLGYIHHREKTLSNAAQAFINLLSNTKQ